MAASVRSNLLKNNFMYEAWLDWIDRPGVDMDAISQAAKFAWLHHAGRFADGRLENHAYRLGQSTVAASSLPAVKPQFRQRRSSKTLHVASELFAVGGHTRVLAKWILRDESASHAVVVTRSTDVPGFFAEIVSDAGGRLMCREPGDSLQAQALKLRQLADGFDRVVLHSHPDDVVPVLAFATKDGPPVAMFNHAHFGFSLGATVSDVVVNTMEYFRQVSEKHRFARQTALLTGTPGLTPLSLQPIDKAACKRLLGIDADAPVALAIAQEHYFKPAAGYNFFLTAHRLLATNSDLRLVMVGLGPESRLIPSNLNGHPRCRFEGRVIDPTPYYRAADLCLESFPMPSLGAVLEAVTYGETFPVPVYGPAENVLRLPQAPALSYAYRPIDEQDYLDYVQRLLDRPAETRERAYQLRKSLVALDAGWGATLARLNRTIDALRRDPSEIPTTPMATTEDCQLLADLAPIDLGREIDRRLPLQPAMRAYATAVRQRLLNPADACRSIMRQTFNGAKARLG